MYDAIIMHQLGYSHTVKLHDMVQYVKRNA